MSEATYDRDSHDPAAPVVAVRVGAPDGGTAALVTALVDSGADLSVIPPALARALELPITDVLPVAGVEGVPRSVAVHAAELEFDEERELVEVVAIGDEALIGRNLLNGFVVTLDGPSERLTIVRR